MQAIAETYGYKFSDTNILNYECVVEVEVFLGSIIG